MESLMEYCGFRENGHCGYCGENGSACEGMWAHRLHPADYQQLVNNGWRRSGHFCYKPDLKISCCKLYTIRCCIDEFKLSKNQRRVIKSFNAFVCDDMKKNGRKIVQTNLMGNGDFFVKQPEVNALNCECFNETKTTSGYHPIEGTREKPEKVISQGRKTDRNDLEENISIVTTCDPRKSVKRKASRIERAIQRVVSKEGLSREEARRKLILKKLSRVTKATPLEQLLRRIKTDPAHKFELKFVLMPHQLTGNEYEKYFEIEYQVYKKYQMTVHKEDENSCSRDGFRRFLVKSPLMPIEIKEGNVPINYYGSYHQQYWLDGVLIGVAVLDILPECISSVYFFYDPVYEHLSLGTYSALVEISLARSLCESIPALKYYYMGYYIYSCPKMRYKGRLRPSYLLCPEAGTWHPIKEYWDKVDRGGGQFYQRLNPDAEAHCNTNPTAINDIRIATLHGTSYSFVNYGKYKERNPEGKRMTACLQTIGDKVARNVIIIV